MPNVKEPSRLLLTADEAAKALGLSLRTLYALSSPRGPLPCVRPSVRVVRYSPSALQAWIDQQQAVPR
jgi:excisionase family DNA binding protein